MRFDILTLFPDLVDGVLSESIIGRARKAGHLTVHAHNIRDWSEDKNRRVDDTPYGGGMGMLMAAPPVYNCYKSVFDLAPDLKTRVIYMSPKGRIFFGARNLLLTLKDVLNLLMNLKIILSPF